MSAQPTDHAPPGMTPDATPAADAPSAQVAALHARSGWGALFAGLRRGFHPQLLIAWLLMVWLPAAIVALPAVLWLYLNVGHSPQAATLAADASGDFLSQALTAMRGEEALLAAGAGFGLLLAVLLSPWLTGMIVAQIRTVYRLRLGGVIRAGLGEYLRMLRMLAWSLLLMMVAAALGVAAMLGIEWMVQNAASVPVSEQPLALADAGWFLPLLFVLLVHVTMEAGRGWLGADLALRSVLEAWHRGLHMLLRRPGATMVVYLGTTLVGHGLAFGFLRLRTLLEVDGWPGWLLAFACTQLMVASLAWGRSARLHGLADLATAEVIAAPKEERASRPRRSSLPRRSRRLPDL
ncbi:hypothetical protein [Lysobacter terrae]